MALTNELVQSIQSQLAAYLNGNLVEDVLKRLDSFGYIIKDADSWLIGFAIEKVRNTIQNECNTSGIPEGLGKIAVDMACGEFLFTKKQTGQLEIGDLDLVGAESSIKLGDAQVNFSGESDLQKFNLLIDYLLNYGRGDFICYRKMRW